MTDPRKLKSKPGEGTVEEQPAYPKASSEGSELAAKIALSVRGKEECGKSAWETIKSLDPLPVHF